MNPLVFREYDIRGVVETDFDDDFIVDLGRAYATILHRVGRSTVTLGRVWRFSSDRLCWTGSFAPESTSCRSE